MFKIVILLTAIAGALDAAVPQGLQAQYDGRIVGGNPTSIYSFPFQVSIHNNGNHFCGGSIYSEHIIITAAHCLKDFSFKSFKVRAGSSLWKFGGVYVAVKSYKYHESYDPITRSNDIALIRLNTPLVFSSTIKPIKLATVNPESGTVGIASGWGSAQFGSNLMSHQLKYAELEVLSREDCASSRYKYNVRIKPNMICTYNVGKDTCVGDSGGPLIYGNELVGVISWGHFCASEGYPGVYTSVAMLREWILTTVAKI